MTAKTFCDACGNDMTDDPGIGRLGFQFDRSPLEVHQRGPRTWPRAESLRIEIGGTRLGNGETWSPSDVCSACVVRAVTNGRVEDLGPVTR